MSPGAPESAPGHGGRAWTSGVGGGEPDRDPRRWAMLALVSVALLLGMSQWFTASAVSEDLRLRWALSAGGAAMLTTVVQIGFVAGTALAAVLNFADIVPARIYFPVSALLGALANAALLIAPSFAVALTLRFLTGFFLAGVYPPAMKMIATWFRSGRGLAIGTVVGALTVGKAGPFLLKALGGASMAPVVLGASLGGVAGALLVFGGYRDGPFPFARRPFSWSLARDVLRHRETMLATGGYLGHMWELYAMWSLITLFFVEHFRGVGYEARAAALAALTGFAVIAVGGVGAVVAGRWADRVGRERVTVVAMLVSGLCSLVMGWLLGAAGWLVVGVALVWGFAIVADSAQFSAVVTEVAPPYAVGTALTLQTMLGFALTGFSIQLCSWLSEIAGWGWAFSVLAVGPLLGIASMVRLGRVRSAG